MDQSDLGSVTVKDKGVHGTQSFTQVAAMLGSRSLPEEARLADVWASIPEVNLWPLQSTTRPQLSVSRETHQVDANALQAMVSGLPGHLQDHACLQDRDQAVRAWLADYPSLAGYRFRSTGAIPDSGPESWNSMQGTIGCRLVWDVVGGDEAAERRFEEIAPWKGRSLSGSTRVIHARFGGDDREIHPLLAWWAVLYTLSMLARYQPGQWTAQIDVNRSKDAVALEYLLDSALAAVPELILAAIDEVTT